MLLTPQHRRSARVAARMQKTARQDFNERVANGTMTRTELLNAPKCLRNFDEAENAILAQDNTSWCGKSQNDESEDDDDEDDFDNESTESMGSNPEGPVGGEFLWGGDEGPAHPLSHLEHSGALIEDPVLLRLIVSKLPPPLVAAIIQQLIQELDHVEREVDEANMAVNTPAEQEKIETPTACVQEDSIASRLLARRLKASRGW